MRIPGIVAYAWASPGARPGPMSRGDPELMARTKSDPYGDPYAGSGLDSDDGMSRGRKILIVIGVFLTVMALAFAGLFFWFNSSLGNVAKVNLDLDEASRPVKAEAKGTNFLLLGADDGNETANVSAPKPLDFMGDSQLPEWPKERYYSDTVMLVHLNEERTKAWVISIPRDSYVPILDENGEETELNKIKNALYDQGPASSIATVENLTGVRVDHMAMLDMNSFIDVSNALGGVTVEVAGEGEQTLIGLDALRYVRNRELSLADFDRIKRQQNFIRATLNKLADAGTLTNPAKLKDTLDAVTSNLAVDAEWSNGDLRSLAFSLRGLRADDISFTTMPAKDSVKKDGKGTVLPVDQEKANDLFAAVRADDVDSWLDANPGSRLGNEELR